MKKILFTILLYSIILSHYAQESNPYVGQTLICCNDDDRSLPKILLRVDTLPDAEANLLLNAYIQECDQKQRDQLKFDLTMRLYQAAFPKHPTDELRSQMARFGPMLGDLAPDLALTDSIRMTDIAGKKLLFFYDTSCHRCAGEKANLRHRMPELAEKGYTIIAIACNSAATMEDCQYNIADSGEMCRAYGVLQTPLYLYINEQNVIAERFSKINDF